MLLLALSLALLPPTISGQSVQELQEKFSKLVKDADDLIHAEKHKAAIEALDEALSIMDAAGAGFAEGDLRFNRAAALKAEDRYEEAVADYEVSISKNPKGEPACAREPLLVLPRDPDASPLLPPAPTPCAVGDSGLTNTVTALPAHRRGRVGRCRAADVKGRAVTLRGSPGLL